VTGWSLPVLHADDVAAEPEQTPLRTFVADNQPLIVDGIRSLGAALHLRVEVVGVAASASSLIGAPGLEACNLLVVDPRIADDCDLGIRRLPLLRELRDRYPGLPIVVLTLLDNPAVLHELLALDMRTVVSKLSPSPELLVAMRRAAMGETYLCARMRRLVEACPMSLRSALSKREREVIRLLAQGLTVTTISEHLSRSVKTVSRHKINAMRKLGIENHSQLYAYAHEAGLDV